MLIKIRLEEEEFLQEEHSGGGNCLRSQKIGSDVSFTVVTRSSLSEK